ncbi:MAG: CsbD family protein [Betaproteobacteria bacterium]|nr:CsbD family protein [Betaproteobacteria bacterium]
MTVNKDQVKGRIKEAQGKIKEVAGNLVGNETLEAKGTLQKIAGQTQAKFGDIKKELQDAKKGH